MKLVPPCPLFGQCGGCQYQDITYADEIQIKQDNLEALLRPLDLSPGTIKPILKSPQEYHYRNRLDLKLQRRKSINEVHVGFSSEGRKNLLIANSCAIARQEISDFIPQLRMQAIARLPDKYKVANLVVRSGDEGKVFWGGIGRGSLKLECEQYFSTQILGRRIHYSLETFFQANLFILPSVMEMLRALPIWKKEVLFFDLYGGVGLFGICFADLVKEVVLIEENVPSVAIARYNANYNQLSNFKLYDGRVEDVLPKLLEGDALTPKIVMVDPPRAGLSKPSVDLLNHLKGVEYLMYLSCDPKSLTTNLFDLKPYWQIETVLPFDFFPRTKHLETFVLLKRLHPLT